MAITLEVTHNGTSGIVNSGQMMAGQIGEIVQSNGGYSGFVLRSFLGWILLNSPSADWSTNPGFKVRILQPGEAVTLKVK